MKPKYEGKAKLFYIHIDSFIAYIKSEDIYVHIAKDAEIWFNTSNYKLERPLPNGKIKKRSWINEKQIRWKSNVRLCCIKTENI